MTHVSTHQLDTLISTALILLLFLLLFYSSFVSDKLPFHSSLMGILGCLLSFSLSDVQTCDANWSLSCGKKIKNLN